MANNYVQTSVALEHVTPKELEWFKQFATAHEDLELSDEEFKEWMEARGQPEMWPDFDYDIENEEGDLKTVYVYSEECSSLDNICVIIQAFIAKFRPKKSIGVEWAFTCSSMRPGEFGGGAAFITAKGTKFTNTGDWLRKQRHAWEKRNARKQ